MGDEGVDIFIDVVVSEGAKKQQAAEKDTDLG